MVIIAKSIEVRATVDAVWDVVTDSKKEQEYWTNIRNVKLLSTKGNVVEREAEVGPAVFSQRTRQTIILDPKRSVRLTIEGESIEGERTITLTPLGADRTRVDVTWDLRPENVPGFVEGILKGKISGMTEKALASMAAAAARTVTG